MQKLFVWRNKDSHTQVHQKSITSGFRRGNQMGNLSVNYETEFEKTDSLELSYCSSLFDPESLVTGIQPFMYEPDEENTHSSDKSDTMAGRDTSW